MTNRPFRPFDFEKDMKAVERIWIECGWIDDSEEDRKHCQTFFKTGETEVATIDGEAECSVHWTEGTIRYQEETLPMGAVTAVTTSHIGRKQGFAKDLTARSLARQHEAGMAVSVLGMFDQGFYDLVGYGSGPYESYVQFDPMTLKVNAPHRPPKRLTADDYEQIHQAMLKRKMYHGGTTLKPALNVFAELSEAEHPYGLGYFDGANGELTHFIWGEMKNENGPYRITMRAYQNRHQLLELLALIKSLGDQVSSFITLEFGEFQLQDMLKLPFRTRRNSKGGQHEQLLQALAYWQIRILNLKACLAKTHLPGPGVRFNLQLSDPLDTILESRSPYRGLSGDYIIDLGPESNATPGSDKKLPTLKASINAFTRLWFGVRPASNLAISDDLSGDEELIEDLDRLVRLPKPHLGWDF